MRNLFVAGLIWGAAGLSTGLAAGTAMADPSHYDLHARIDPHTGKLTTHLVMTLQPQDLKTETGFLLGQRFTLTRMDAGPGAVVSATPEDVAHIGKVHHITVRLAAAPTRPVRLTLDYSGPLPDPDDKTDVSFRPDLNELRLENMWLPARDNLSMNYTADAEIDGIAPDKVVVAQGQVSHTGWKVRIHRTFADFDIPLTAATGLKRFQGDNVEVYARDFDNMLSKAFVAQSVKALAFEESLFGPLPQGGPVRIVVSPRQKGGAYARKIYINSSDARDELAAAKTFDPAGPAALVAHEFGHAWWWAADPLTDNYWLAESLAEYTSMRFIESEFGLAKRDEILAKKREAAKTAGPVLAGKRPTKSALYQKGPVLLFDLDAEIGRAKMDRLLRLLAGDPPHVTADFLAKLTEVAGPDAAHDFEAKLKAP